ncbi:MAG: hypothetical protein HOP11_15680, partial [Saprospiraceae bacterium]|nr:hypothetical protein [Saprospiraceae bacterium]
MKIPIIVLTLLLYFTSFICSQSVFKHQIIPNLYNEIRPIHYSNDSIFVRMHGFPGEIIYSNLNDNLLNRTIAYPFKYPKTSIATFIGEDSIIYNFTYETDESFCRDVGIDEQVTLEIWDNKRNKIRSIGTGLNGFDFEPQYQPISDII